MTLLCLILSFALIIFLKNIQIIQKIGNSSHKMVSAMNLSP